jgi:hypothetical protein
MSEPERTRTLQYLELLQKQVYESLGQEPRGFDKTKISAWIDEMLAASFPDDALSQADRKARKAAMLAQAEREAASLPTRYEDWADYGMLRQYVEALREAGNAMRWPLPPSPIYGSLPTGRVNAITVRVPRSADHLVLFESHLFFFTMLLCKAVLRAFPPAGPHPRAADFLIASSEIDQRIEADPSIVDRFSDVILNYVVRGSPADAAPYHLEPGHGKSLEVLRGSTELFVLGHEYGHVIAKHLDHVQPVAGMIHGTAMQAIVYSWHQEYEADAIGLRLSMGTMRYRLATDTALNYCGADLFFSATDVVDRAVSLLRTGNETQQRVGSHPPARFRREELRAQIPRVLARTRARDAAAADADVRETEEFSKKLEYVVERLWERTRPAVVRLRDAGIKPADLWGSSAP